MVTLYINSILNYIEISHYIIQNNEKTKQSHTFLPLLIYNN